jgi:hypothetical protein
MSVQFLPNPVKNTEQRFSSSEIGDSVKLYIHMDT